MAIVLNIRGPNGSGKSTLVRAWMGQGFRSTHLAGTRVTFPAKGINRIALGHYTNPTGGCDGIKTQDEVCDIVRRAVLSVGSDEIIFEGVVVSTIFQRYLDLDLELTALGHTYVWLFLAYDPQICFQRIYLRNGCKPIKEYKVWEKIECVESCRRRALAARRLVLTYKP